MPARSRLSRCWCGRHGAPANCERNSARRLVRPARCGHRPGSSLTWCRRTIPLPMVEVILDPGAVAILAPFRGGTFVSLQRSSVADESASVILYAGGQRVGALNPADGLLYQPALDAAQQAGHFLEVEGLLSEGPGGALQLRIFPAGIL